MIEGVRRISWQEPPKEISLREQCHGGPVRDTPIERPAGALQRSRRVVLLIHGFNVDMCAAVRSYEIFVSRLHLQWKARSISVYWPGDAAPKSETRLTPVITPVMSLASYPHQPKTAERAAEVLWDHIFTAIMQRKARTQTSIRLSIVAHSLGCRLALELLKFASSSVKEELVRIELVVLMAAAVPIYDVAASGSYDLSRWKAKKTVIYYSARDSALKGPFRVGQRSYSTTPTTFVAGREALGLHGMARVSLRNVEQIPVSNAHGDYWPDWRIPPKVMLELDGIQRRVSRRVLIPRELESGRSMAGRSIAGRQIRGMARDNDCRCS